VEEDPFEANLRKTLNYGHTLGHAIESYFLSAQDRITLLHGEAIAIGMILATYISREQLGFPKDQCEDIKSSILRTFPRVDFKESDFSPIIQLLKHDKKNEHGNVNFVLLEAIGKAQIDCQVDNDLILNAFKYYAS
jgi:3-dehydroquinate synthase